MTQDFSWNNKQLSDLINIAQLGLPPLPFLVFYLLFKLSTNTAVWGSALPGVELGLLWSDSAVLTTWL